jgi:hypothetical protein
VGCKGNNTLEICNSISEKKSIIFLKCPLKGAGGNIWPKKGQIYLNLLLSQGTMNSTNHEKTDIPFPLSDMAPSGAGRSPDDYPHTPLSSQRRDGNDPA